MNKKGQVLVMFILILPLLFLLLALIINIGFTLYEKKQLESNIELIIENELKNINNTNTEKITNHIKENIEADIINIEFIDNIIKVNIQKQPNSLFNNFFKNNHKINITYKGYIENNKYIIKKE